MSPNQRRAKTVPEARRGTVERRVAQRKWHKRESREGREVGDGSQGIFPFVTFASFARHIFSKLPAVEFFFNFQPGRRHNPVVAPTSQKIPDVKTITLGDRILQIAWSHSEDDRVWDDFILAQPDGHHEQTSRPTFPYAP